MGAQLIPVCKVRHRSVVGGGGSNDRPITSKERRGDRNVMKWRMKWAPVFIIFVKVGGTRSNCMIRTVVAYSDILQRNTTSRNFHLTQTIPKSVYSRGALMPAIIRKAGSGQRRPHSSIKYRVSTMIRVLLFRGGRRLLEVGGVRIWGALTSSRGSVERRDFRSSSPTTLAMYDVVHWQKLAVIPRSPHS